ncbi:unnamed protein product [Spirodela intermedia]|uniref:Uncharacterized protein n=1 Tax=Spirodela intermedia TaxID=51605 RepID=A0A7I8K342_SPIIN|nr:unnamed protein product [Spirodela intermedia]
MLLPQEPHRILPSTEEPEFLALFAIMASILACWRAWFCSSSFSRIL